MAGIFGENVKTAFLKGIEALGKGASTLAEGAQQKLSEINLQNRRREILGEIPECVKELYEQGIELPAKLTELLNELEQLDEKLAAMRPQPAQQEAAEETAEPEAECACEECAEEAECEADEVKTAEAETNEENM